MVPVARVPVLVLSVVLAVALALAVSVWPVAVCVAAICCLIFVLAWKRPAIALWAGVMLFGMEGSIKFLLGLTANPLPVGSRAAGAAALDAALFAGVAGVVVSDRFGSPRRLWHVADGAERVVIVLLAAWIGLSILQIPVSGNLARGLQGFRLIQAYTLVGVAAAIACSHPAARRRAGLALIVIGAAVAAYAVLRMITGASAAEVRFATNVETVASYGRVFRAIGSFSGAVGLSSFVTPLVVFAFVFGLLSRRLRMFAWVVAVLGGIALIGSYSRGSLLGIVFGLISAVAILLAVADVSPRRKIGAVLLVVGVLGAAYAGVRVASEASPELRVRAHGVLDPFHDKSAQLRFKTWRHALRSIARRPLGRGVGTVGGSAAQQDAKVSTTDNSFLQVFVEQGVAGGLLFLAAVLGAVVVFARRLRRAAGEQRSIGVAALAGFVAFLALCATGDYLAQPGKVVAWALLGVVAAQAIDPKRGADSAPNGALP